MIVPDTILSAHNAHRAAHNSPSLTWSQELQDHAQAWADNLATTSCSLEHFSGSDMGENLFMCSASDAAGGCASGSNSAVAVDDAAAGWYESEKTWPLTQPSHITQILWASTTHVGCAVRVCQNNDATTGAWSSEIVVCRYQPPGNVATQYEDNVSPAAEEAPPQEASAAAVEASAEGAPPQEAPAAEGAKPQEAPTAVEASAEGAPPQEAPAAEGAKPPQEAPTAVEASAEGAPPQEAPAAEGAKPQEAPTAVEASAEGAPPQEAPTAVEASPSCGRKLLRTRKLS